MADPQRLTLLVESDGWIFRTRLGDQQLLIGRAARCDVRLPDPGVPEELCRVEPDGSGAWRAVGLAGELRVSGCPGPAAPGEPLGVTAKSVVCCAASRLSFEPAAAGPLLTGDAAHDARLVQLLLEGVEDMARAEDVPDIARRLVGRAIDMAGGGRGALFVAADEGPLWRIAAGGAAGRELDRAERVRDAVARNLGSGRGRFAPRPDESSEAPVPVPEVFGSPRPGIACIPFPREAARPGMLYLDTIADLARFGPAELTALEALVRHGALALDRASWREDEEGLRRQRQRSEARAQHPPQRSASRPVGDSAAMRRTLAQLERIAPSDATVLINGETGAGKEVLARYLHDLSPRSGRPFVVVDCGALPESTIEAELFGHERGAFTGAESARLGRFREADGGTVLLDEIGELPLLLQTRLLRVLQDKLVRPLGGRAEVPVDVRIVCATHQDLGRKVVEGSFRGDLYYRIGVLSCAVPPLREREEDLLILAHHFLRQLAHPGERIGGFTREAELALLAYRWPGNVRELRHRVQRAVLLASGPLLRRADLGLGEGEPSADSFSEDALATLPLVDARRRATERFERAYLDDVLQRSGGSVARAATLSGVSRQLLHRLIRRHGLTRRD